MPSFRLTAQHRQDILHNLMKEWDAQNKAPAPFKGTDVVIQVLIREIKNTKNKELVSYTKLIKYVSNPDHSLMLKGIIERTMEFKVEVPDTDPGNPYTLSYKITKDVADEHGIPYTSIETRKHYGSQFQIIGEPIAKDPHGHNRTYELIRSPFQSYLTTKLTKSDPITKKYNKYVKDNRAHNNERALVSQEFSEYLNQFNTSKQLIDGWPDVVDFMPAHIADPETVIDTPEAAVNTVTKRLKFKNSMKAKRANFDK